MFLEVELENGEGLGGQINLLEGLCLSRLPNLFPFASFCYLPELFINCVVSSRREFADGAEFKTRGTRSQIPENLGHVPEFGARLQIHDRERLRNS